ncbi:MAG: preprotein translocase subunit SecG [Christensenella sp.]|nr:preprotein translocase subunit SecG [Christensenella sp.]
MGLSLLLSAALINYEVARALRITISILFIIVSIGVMVTVMMQKPVSGNIGTIAGENTQTYAGQNKAKNKESILKKVTIIGGVILAVLAIFFFVTYLEV